MHTSVSGHISMGDYLTGRAMKADSLLLLLLLLGGLFKKEQDEIHLMMDYLAACKCDYPSMRGRIYIKSR